MVFIDRDGVVCINNKWSGSHDDYYVLEWEQFKFIPRAKEAIANISAMGWNTLIITNQNCISKGLTTRNKVEYIHMAGHEQVEENLIIDTHGEPIIDPVYDLFEYTIQQMDPVPVLLERDYNFQDLPAISAELENLKSIIKTHWEVEYEAAK